MEKDPTLSLLHTVDAYDFEHIIADLWERQGWTTQVTQSSNDKGVDVIAERSTPYAQKVVIQAKRYEPTSSVSSSEVQQYASLRHQLDDVDVVLIVTTARFSTQAENVADALNVKLIDGAQLYELFKKHDAFDILNQYVDALRSTSEPDPTESADSTIVNSDIEAEIAESHIGHTGYVEWDTVPDDPTSARTGRTNDPNKKPPDNLADLIDLQETLRDELKHVDQLADDAWDAFEAKDFHGVIDQYTKARGELLGLQADVSRYKTGFDRVDQSAASHLTPPSEFQSAVPERNEQFTDQIAEAEELAEQQDALKRLADEVENDAARAKKQIIDGDRAHERGEYDTANEHYETAEAAVREVEETLDTYQALANEYERAIPEEWETPPADVSVRYLQEMVENQLDQDRERIIERNFSTATTGNPVPNPGTDDSSKNTPSVEIDWKEI